MNDDDQLILDNLRTLYPEVTFRILENSDTDLCIEWDAELNRGELAFWLAYMQVYGLRFSDLTEEEQKTYDALAEKYDFH